MGSLAAASKIPADLRGSGGALSGAGLSPPGLSTCGRTWGSEGLVGITYFTPADRTEPRRSLDVDGFSSDSALHDPPTDRWEIYSSAGGESPLKRVDLPESLS